MLVYYTNYNTNIINLSNWRKNELYTVIHLKRYLKEELRINMYSFSFYNLHSMHLFLRPIKCTFKFTLRWVIGSSCGQPLQMFVSPLNKLCNVIQQALNFELSCVGKGILYGQFDSS